MKKDLLIIFAKAPREKQVKTRLRTRLTLGARQQLQAAFIRDTLSRTASLRVSRVLACTSMIEDPFFYQCHKKYGVDRILQEGAHLGQRMQNGFRWGFSNGFQKVVLIGTDSPTLPVSFVAEAFYCLNTVPMVLGPAIDGGYYLIGFRATSPLPKIFERIKWGSKTVFTNTLKRLRRCHLLPFWYDVDRPSDLDLLKEHLRFLKQEGKACETGKIIKRL